MAVIERHGHFAHKQKRLAHFFMTQVVEAGAHYLH
jgi:hypothetical protein